MEHTDTIPPPKSLADQLREIPVGSSAFFDEGEHKPNSIRSTLTRIKAGGSNYTTRPEGDGTRVWRLA